MKVIKGGALNKGNEKIKNFDTQLKEVIKSSMKQPNIIQNTSGIQYSKFLLHLAEPHFKFGDDDFFLDMAAAGWNLAVYKKLAPDFYKQVEKQFFSGKNIMPKETALLIKGFMKEKEALYSDLHVIIKDCFIDEDDLNRSYVKALTIPFEGFVSNIFPESMDKRNAAKQEESDDFNFPTVNRQAVTIKPKQPLVNWLAKIFFPEPPPGKFEENNIYLIPEAESNEAIMKWLGKNFEIIFKNELWMWHTDSKDWPPNRTFKMFREWFTIEINSLVFDLDNTELKRD
jgi:hypothetical protein